MTVGMGIIITLPRVMRQLRDVAKQNENSLDTHYDRDYCTQSIIMCIRS